MICKGLFTFPEYSLLDICSTNKHLEYISKSILCRRICMKSSVYIYNLPDLFKILYTCLFPLLLTYLAPLPPVSLVGSQFVDFG